MASGGGGGVGGGKIRTRRYHLGAAKPPYARSKQQGIISRVTESVKSIVPGWLQKYFNKSEEECVDTNESTNQEENPVNYHHDYANEDTIMIDGRVTPESARINLEEPSTSRSALNFSDVLTRPSLHRSHLNCTMLDSTVPHCQPSTSSSFGIGSPGLSLVKEIKDSTSQHDDDNISTTSGFSSRASDKDITVSKNTSAPLLWSTEAERSHSLSQHHAASSKKPAFNLSAFGSPSPSLGNTSLFKTSQLGDSPFYPGKTTYGGAAAAARETKARIAPYQPPVRRQMKAKQANVQSYGVTSSTARRILQSLEKMSSPLADAKRIPSSVSSPLSSPVDRSILDITSFQSKRNQMESQHPPVQKLVTPKAISLSVSRTQYFKPSLSPAADSGKIHQGVDTKHKGMREQSFPAEQRVKPSESNLTYPKFSPPASNGLSSGAGVGGGGKMRRERGVHYVSKPGQEEQEVEEPVLPKVPLPISTASLPSFNFSFLASSSVSSSPSTVSTAVTNKVQPASNVGSPVFRFSSPIVKSTEAEVLPPLSQIGFTFSVPVVKSAELSGSSDTPVTSLLTLDTTTVNSTSNKKGEKEEYNGPSKPAKVLKEGSVLDILKSPGNFKFEDHGSFKFGIASESASSNTGGFKFPTSSADFKFGVSSSDSKSEDSKKEGKSNSFTFGLPSTSSQAPSTFQFGTASLGQQEKKEEPVLGSFGFGTSSTSSSIAINENKTGVGGFTFGTVAEKEVASPALVFKKSDEKKDETLSTKAGFSFGIVEAAPASQFVLGRTEEKQDSVTSAAPLAFRKKADNEELKAQPIFSAGMAEHTKEESTAKPIFNFSFAKPSEKESEQAKPTFAFGAQTSNSDQGVAKPSFSFLSSSSSSTVVPTTSANSSSVFGSAISSSNPQPVPAPFVFGQPSNTVSSSVFGNSADSAASQSFGFSQENKPATTSSSTGTGSFLFGLGASSTNTANSGFNFGATTTSSSTGSSSSFLFGSGPSAPAAGPAFGTSQAPAFGQSQGSSQPSAPSFGSLSTPLFSAGAQPAPPAFGSVTSSTQPSLFGQQATQQPGFGSGAPSAGSVFQFGSNFPNNPGVFTFGASLPAPAAPAQPSGSSGFPFSQPPGFTVGTNGKNVFSASGSSVSGRKIKTAVRRRK
ncbi:hypothetical protein Q9233_004355 [Columba guinea]|nr:hypothetical protein Q9233_004355 [Columba guinea]